MLVHTMLVHTMLVSSCATSSLLMRPTATSPWLMIGLPEGHLSLSPHGRTITYDDPPLRSASSPCRLTSRMPSGLSRTIGMSAAPAYL
jgi:hypothetical protein